MSGELKEHMRWELQLKTKEDCTVQSAWRLGGTQECLEERAADHTTLTFSLDTW